MTLTISGSEKPGQARFTNNSAQHTRDGIEIKASRYPQGWQGHNPENTWLMVFVFKCNKPGDIEKGKANIPFHFLGVAGAHIMKSDWTFSGRKGKSRRTITASVRKSGYKKMMANWIYRSSDIRDS